MCLLDLLERREQTARRRERHERRLQTLNRNPTSPNTQAVPSTSLAGSAEPAKVVSKAPDAGDKDKNAPRAQQNGAGQKDRSLSTAVKAPEAKAGKNEPKAPSKTQKPRPKADVLSTSKGTTFERANKPPKATEPHVNVAVREADLPLNSARTPSQSTLSRRMVEELEILNEQGSGIDDGGDFISTAQGNILASDDTSGICYSDSVLKSRIDDGSASFPAIQEKESPVNDVGDFCCADSGIGSGIDDASSIAERPPPVHSILARTFGHEPRLQPLDAPSRPAPMNISNDSPPSPKARSTNHNPAVIAPHSEPYHSSSHHRPHITVNHIHGPRLKRRVHFTPPITSPPPKLPALHESPVASFPPLTPQSLTSLPQDPTTSTVEPHDLMLPTPVVRQRRKVRWEVESQSDVATDAGPLIANGSLQTEERGECEVGFNVGSNYNGSAIDDGEDLETRMPPPGLEHGRRIPR